MKYKTILMFLIILTFLLFYMLGPKLFNNKALQIKELNMYLTVSNYTGFNINTDALYFGTIPGGGIGRRIITLHNLDTRSMIIIEKEGRLSKWISLSENNFLMGANEVKNLTVSISVPPNAKHGDYTSKLKISFKSMI